MLVGIILLGFLPETALARKAAVTPIVFASTGHKSCQKDFKKRKNSPYNVSLQPEVDGVLEKIKEEFDGVEPKVIYACFEYGKEPFGGRQVFKYTMNNDAIGTVEMGKKALFDKIDYEYIEPAIDAAAYRINEVINETENHVLYLVGHSWGGWLSMKLSTLLPPDINIAALVTIDPISPLDCWPNQYIRLGRGYIKDCKQAPRDIGYDEQQLILDRVGGEWMHYYQRQFYFAMSGPIEALETDVRSFKLRVTRWTINHHSKLQSAKLIWKNFFGVMKKRL